MASERCTVLIASAERLPALIAQGGNGGELLAFTDADALRAIDAIMTRRPAVVVLERTFASTSRGRALINRIKANPSLADTEIRIVAAESTPVGSPPPSDVSSDTAAAPPPQYRITRRVSRVKIAGSIDVRVEGQLAALVDVTTLGAQVLSIVPLKPNQRVRLVLADKQGTARCTAVVIWAAFEITRSSGSAYRVGLEFLDADATAVEAYCSRRKAQKT